MVKLEPLQQEDFEPFLAGEIRVFAEDHVRSGNCPAEGAYERPQNEFEHYLPDGIRSKDRYLFPTLDGQNDKVGVLWVRVKDRKAFTVDFVLEEAIRGKGYGKQALAALDETLKLVDLESVSLHVFGDNLTAQNLYQKVGYPITGIHMKRH